MLVAEQAKFVLEHAQELMGNREEGSRQSAATILTAASIPTRLTPLARSSIVDCTSLTT